MFLYFYVSEENIKKANSKQTPLHLAVKDAGINKFSLFPTRLVINYQGKIYETKFRGVFRKFQEDYLAGKPVKPIEGDLKFFPLEEIQKSIRMHLVDRTDRESECNQRLEC